MYEIAFISSYIMLGWDNMYYYYKIENRINHNKYIGITTNPTVRKKWQYYEDFCSLSDFPILLKSKGAKKSARKLSKEQVFIILLNEERHFTTWTALRKKYKNSNRGENYMGD